MTKVAVLIALCCLTACNRPEATDAQVDAAFSAEEARAAVTLVLDSLALMGGTDTLYYSPTHRPLSITAPASVLKGDTIARPLLPWFEAALQSSGRFKGPCAPDSDDRCDIPARGALLRFSRLYRVNSGDTVVVEITETYVRPRTNADPHWEGFGAITVMKLLWVDGHWRLAYNKLALIT